MKFYHWSLSNYQSMARRQKKAKRRTLKKKLGNGIHQLKSNEEEDRLSSLPDNLLISILSLLPISSAVVTSVLSHRWRYLWTHITCISFDRFWVYKGRFIRLQNPITTISHVISKLNSPKIHTFRIDVSYLNAHEQTLAFLLAPGVHEICLRNPEVINIDIEQHGLKCHLPTSLLKIQSLVELRLNSTFEFDYAADAGIVINLPKLKILEFSLSDSHRHLMHTLFKSCPLLEQLCLHLNFKENDHQVDIRAPNLKFLTIMGHHIRYILIIDTPKLVNLEIDGFDPLVFYHFVKNSRGLREAKIIIPGHHVGDGNSYLSRILDLFQGISYARSLTIDRCFDVQFLDVALPSFHNLVNLSICGRDLDSNSWIPSCLLSNVKSIKLIHMYPNDYGIRLLRDILSKATVLQHVQVSLNDVYVDEKTRVGDEYEFAMKLFEGSRCSTNCHIELSGAIITASSKNFKYGQLYCKLDNRIYIPESESEITD